MRKVIAVAVLATTFAALAAPAAHAGNSSAVVSLGKLGRVEAQHTAAADEDASQVTARRWDYVRGGGI